MQSIARYHDIFDSGEDSGRGKEKIEMAKSLLQDHLPIEFISKHTMLSEQEIEKIAEELQK